MELQNTMISQPSQKWQVLKAQTPSLLLLKTPNESQEIFTNKMQKVFQLVSIKREI